MKISSIFGGAKEPSQTDNNTSTSTTYTKEVPYLPSYYWVKATKFSAATADSPFDKIEFLIHNAQDKPVFETYKAIFIKDGWSITREVEFFGFTAEKDTHLANVSIIKLDKDVVLSVYAQLKR